MSQENDSSVTSPEITCTTEDGKIEKVVTKSEMNAMTETSDVGTVVRVSDDSYKYYILLDDKNGRKFWNPFSGDVDFALKSNKWFKKGQEIFENKSLPPGKADELREVILSISVLGNYFEWDEETVGTMMDQLVVKFSFDLFKINTGYTGTLEDLKENEDYFGYINATAIMVKSFLNLVESVKDSVEAATEEQKTVDKAL